MRVTAEVWKSASTNRQSKMRGGFTLIELLVVIAIISVLAAMLTGTVFKALSKAKEVQVSVEIRQLDMACESFKNKYGRYPPPFIVLDETGSWTASPDITPAMIAFSVTYLETIFPGINVRLNITDTPGDITDDPNLYDRPGIEWHDWNGNGTRGGTFVLEGDECLIYFLGGIPFRDAGGDGVTTNPGSDGVFGTSDDIISEDDTVGAGGFCSDPTRPTLNARREPSFFEFDAKRLAWPFIDPKTTWERKNQFPVYVDNYGWPYAYFGTFAGNTDNYIRTDPAGYNSCGALMSPNAAIPDTLDIDNDGNSAETFTFVPYWKTRQGSTPPSPVTFWQGQRFQIISAGRDRLFGSGGKYVQLDPRSQGGPHLRPDGSVVQGLSRADYDNLTNFAGGRLETGQ